MYAFAIIHVVKLINSRDTFKYGLVGLLSTLIYNKFIAIYNKQLQYIYIYRGNKYEMNASNERSIDFFRSINQDVGIKGCYFFSPLSFMYKLIVLFILKRIRINISSVKL